MKVKIVKEVYDTVEKIHYVKPNKMVNEKAPDGNPQKPLGTIVDLPRTRAEVIVKNGYGIYVDEVAKIKKPRATKTNLKKVK